MITKHPGIESIIFTAQVSFSDDESPRASYEVALDLHEMSRLVVAGELPASVKAQRDAIAERRAISESQGEPEEE
jgi:hypothetical protein